MTKWSLLRRRICLGNGFYYIVADISGKKYFVGTAGVLTDDFDTVIRFESQKDAEDYASGLDTESERPRVLRFFG